MKPTNAKLDKFITRVESFDLPSKDKILELAYRARDLFEKGIDINIPEILKELNTVLFLFLTNSESKQVKYEKVKVFLNSLN